MKFVYCSKGNPHVDIMMSDLYKCNEVIVLDGTLKSVENIFLRIIRKVHMNKKINRIINLPMKRIWLNSHMPKLKKEEDYCFIFIDSVPYALDFTWLKRLRGKSNGKVRFLLFLFNPVELFKERTVYDLKNIIFDYVLTYDFSDSQKYGFIQYNAPYSIVQNEEVVVEKDMYLICWNKGRLPVLHQIYKDAVDHGASSICRITDVQDEDQVYKDGIIYNQRIDYDEVIKEFCGCNCIIDVLSPGHTGISTRYYEAVCYNKKLLTNNKNIVNLPFYNSDYMHVFESPEDIDWEWVKERVPVDYHYDGRFSPLRLLDKIKELCHCQQEDAC